VVYSKLTDDSEIAGEYGSKSLYRNLGYFSLICLLRVHVLLGDPTRERSSEPADNSCIANHGGRRVRWRGFPYTNHRVSRCDILSCRLKGRRSLYQVGCAYMALGRWPDAIKTFVSVLIFFIRMKQYHTRSYQYGSVRLFEERADARSLNNVKGCTLSLPSARHYHLVRRMRV
jgi:translation initiation factor 3 subunit L